MRDLFNSVSLLAVVAAAALTATPTPTVIDRQGYESLLLQVGVGIGGITFTGTNKLEIVVEHSDDNVTFTPVTVDDLQGAASVSGTGVVLAWTSAKAAATLDKFGYIGGRRYVRVTPTFGGTHATGTPVAVTAVLGWPHILPVA